ncbi:class IV adenylate cyclase [Thermogutta sp.]|uniref:class IV adenylate cyclase n=1 Tax=Thermogutta sp. TaxID=1962930 RepID=UPI00321FD325
MSASLEVEFKFRDVDLASVEKRLCELHAVPEGVREEVDLYFAHPARDFSRTDEALRIRRIGDRNWITYKGPKIDSVSKTRDEIELPLADGREAWESWKRLLERLGFRPVRQVAKRRKRFLLDWEGWAIEISLDEVADLGVFVELEIVCQHEKMAAARDALSRLAAELGLQTSERRSYLELLLQMPQ